MKDRKNGFTLIELIIALLIFKIIILFFFPYNKMKWEKATQRIALKKAKCELIKENGRTRSGEF
ncbi:prepilin-type N-terminal cleavage/methylation domain-containing protein [Anaeromicrobium sediminis]|nr:prepilin-type N-terminal cleavage/methylation domain-containing protein [Anaeromicrobium sediminis]